MRIALIVEYDGTNYHGFQCQKNVLTVQEELEKSIYRLEKKKIRIKASGRTDAGVHSLGQMVSFDTDSNYPPEVFLNALNHYLPQDIRIKRSYIVRDDFDPRRDAKSRLYRYVIQKSQIRSPFLKNRVLTVSEDLDTEIMSQGASLFLGIHDFTRFTTPMALRETTPLRNILRSEIVENKDLINYMVEGNAFLMHQVRRMTGALLDLGRHVIKLDDLIGMIEYSNKITANSLPPYGLYLQKVYYEEGFDDYVASDYLEVARTTFDKGI